MPAGLLFGSDEAVVAELATNWAYDAKKYENAIAIIGADGKFAGAVLFHNWNGYNVELSYFGKGTMSAGIVRCLARFILVTFSPSRLTVVTSKRNKRLLRSFQRLGFKLEGLQHCYYGHKDCTRNTGVRFMMPRLRIEELARLEVLIRKAA